MAYLPILLGVRRARQEGGGRKAPPLADSKTRASILKRDDNTCQYCGFASAKHHTVRWHENGKSSDFVTACLFCDQCFSLESAGVSSSGVLIWMPELTQAEVNHICRAAYLALSDEHYAEVAQLALDSLMVRRYEARRRCGTDDPFILAAVLSDVLSDEDYANRAMRLDGLRLMPLDRRIVRRQGREVDVFPEMVNYWKETKGPFGKVSPGKWAALLEKLGGGAPVSA